MQIDPTLQSEVENYKLLTNLIIPRPIAWITSMNESDVINLAPFSFFNAISSDPIYVVIGIGERDSGGLKDTAKNILLTKDFVINMITENLLSAMNVSAIDFPPEESEVTAAKLNTLSSVKIKTPRLKESLVSLECKLFKSESLGSSTLIIGEIVMFHVDDKIIGPRAHISGYAPIGRLGSPSMYCRTNDRFELRRLNRWPIQE